MMATLGLLPREQEELCSPLFDGETTIEGKIQALQDIGATKVSNRRWCRWLNDSLLLELVPRLDADEIRGLFAPPPWGEKPPLSAFCMTSTAREWDVFRTIDMDVQASLMRFHMKESSSGRHLDEDETVALKAWHRIDSQTRETIKKNFLPHLLGIYEARVRAFVMEESSDDDNDLLALEVQDPFHRLLLHGVCEFYNVASETTSSTVRDCGSGDKVRKTTTIRKRSGTGAPSRITLLDFLARRRNGSL
uniref:Uncharacterized protein n=1 Tax=Avena sativa TaxID=4498 RepID=A0ACD5W5R4_AVESA